MCFSFTDCDCQKYANLQTKSIWVISVNDPSPLSSPVYHAVLIESADILYCISVGMYNRPAFIVKAALSEVAKWAKLIFNDNQLFVSNRHFPDEDDSCYIGPQDDGCPKEFIEACRALHVYCEGYQYGTR